MRSISIFHLVVVLASAVVLTQAMPPREEVIRLLNRLQQHELREAARYNDIGHNYGYLDGLASENMMRYMVPEYRQNTEEQSGDDQKRVPTDNHNQQNRWENSNFDEIDNTSLSQLRKKNFDEIDNSGLYSLKKKNFDEIDNAGLGGFQKKNDKTKNANFNPKNKNQGLFLYGY